VAGDEGGLRALAIDGGAWRDPRLLCRGLILDSATFSPTGARAAAVTRDRTRLLVCDLGGQPDPIRVPGKHFSDSPVFRPDGRGLVALDEGAGRVLLIDASTGRTLSESSLPEGISPDRGRSPAARRLTMALSPGRLDSVLYLAGPGSLATWDFRSEVIARHDEPLSGELDPHSLSPDGRLLAIREPRVVQLLDAATLAVRTSLPGHADHLTRVAFSPDGARLASGDVGGSVRLWDVATGQDLIELEGHSGPIDFLQFTPDGARLVAASRRDGRVVIWCAR
jgi:WD40 repeat protein